MSEVFSHSRLASFEDCPRKFEYRYVLRLPAESESIEGFVGRRVHEVLERLYDFAGRGQVPSLERVLRRYHALWEEQWDPGRVRVVRDDASVDDYRADGERCLANYYRRHYPFDRDETLGLEERVAFSLDAGGSYRIQGFVDRLVRARDGALEIHDYKTGRRVPRQQHLDGDRQLALYEIGVRERWGDEQPVRLVWHFLMSGQTRTSTRTPDQLEAVRRETIELIDRIREERRFEPRPGPLCRWCEYRDRCPAGPAARAAAAGARTDPEVEARDPRRQIPLL
jgi:putative RecB family exonuclease